MTTPQPVVLLCCFNRKAKTLACLQSLYAQQVKVSVVLVDDGSTDGTSLAVQAQFPQVIVIQGSGALYWNGAMRLAWQQALAMFPQAPAFIWLNDDVQLDVDALPRLLATVAALPAADLGAVTAAMREPKGHQGHQLDVGNNLLSYGGRRSMSRWFPLRMSGLLAVSNEAQSCDFIHGNLCYIPAAAVNKVGILSEHFTHAMGDYDYGLRLKRAGLQLFQAPGSYGECASNSDHGGVLDAAVPFKTRLAMLKQPNRWPPAAEWRYFVSQHGGPFSLLLQLPVLLRQYCPALFIWWRARKLAPKATGHNTIYQLHQQYRQKGGEDEVVAREAMLLKNHGLPLQQVLLPAVQRQTSVLRKIQMLAGWFGWPIPLPAPLSKITHGDTVLVHNLFPALSPWLLRRMRQRGAKVVVTLHNFRPLTPAAVLPPATTATAPSLKLVWQQWRRPARAEGRIFSLLMALANYLQHQQKAWWQVDCLWCPSEFVRQQYLAAGYPSALLQVKPHFYPLDASSTGAAALGINVTPSAQPYVLFVGRADAQKGLAILLALYQQAPENWPALYIAGVAGDDSLAQSFFAKRAAIHQPSSQPLAPVQFYGAVDQAQLSALYQQALMLLVPSQVAETFGNVVMEAFAHGLPVLAARAGALAELVEHNVNGLLFTSNDPIDLTTQLERILQDLPLREQLAAGAQLSYQRFYTAKVQWQYYQQVLPKA